MVKVTVVAMSVQSSGLRSDQGQVAICSRLIIVDFSDSILQ